jgi:hypothetical protein
MLLAQSRFSRCKTILLQGGKNMSAITEQRMIDLDTLLPVAPEHPLPTVIYNAKGKLIIATIIISPASDPAKYRHEAPPICLPGPKGSTWTVLWTLLSAGGLSATFETNGIAMPTESSPIVFYGSTTLPPPMSNQCQGDIAKAAGTGSVKYQIQPIVINGNGVVLKHSVVEDAFDPTIALVEEPMG